MSSAACESSDFVPIFFFEIRSKFEKFKIRVESNTQYYITSFELSLIDY